MIRFKAFTTTALEGMKTIPDLVNEWLEEERPKTIYSSNLQIVTNMSVPVHVLTIFYEDNPATNYMKKGD